MTERSWSTTQLALEGRAAGRAPARASALGSEEQRESGNTVVGKRLEMGRGGRTDPTLLQVATLSIWLTCAMIGGVGLRLKYPWPREAVKEPEPVTAQRIEVETATDPAAPAEQRPVTAENSPPPLPDAVSAAEAPALVPVAAADAPVAFALPVDGATRVVDAREASAARATPAKTDAAPARVVQQLTYGLGEGRQPAPRYPREAVIAHEEGTVVVRFTVGEEGRVLSAEAATPSRWPSLNSSAVSTVRDRWVFQRGAVRVYEVAIHFRLN